MKFRLNGSECEYLGSGNVSLLHFLRVEKGFISAKDGCSGQGVCGCCTVMVDKKPKRSCIFPMERVQDGMEIDTLEGFSPTEKDIFSHAFIEKGGVQCGFCTPGMVMAAKGILEKNPNPDRVEIQKGLRRNLCRCTGYAKIIDSIQYAGEIFRNAKTETAPAKSSPQSVKVGDRLTKYESRASVLGQKPFVVDMKMDGLLHGALHFSSHPRALIKKIHTEKAKLVKGVTGVFTAKDIPGSVKVGLIISDWNVMVPEGLETCYQGDVLAVVVAESEQAARYAVKQIEVEYDVLEPITQYEQALAPMAPSVHRGKSNLLSQSHICRGQPKKILEESTFVAKGTYETQCVEHAYLEPEACLAIPESTNRLKVYSQGQGVYEDQRQIAEILGVSGDRVCVELVPNGGGFGGKEDLSVQGHTALAAWLLQKPVRIVLNRDESMRMHPKKHPMRLEYELGCDVEGKLTALVARIQADSGAYASVGMKVLERAVGHASGAYHIPHVWVEGTAVYTNNIPNGAMRGFGANQATFAMESAMEELCAMGQFDPFDFRLLNVLKEGGRTATGQKINQGAGAEACLRAIEPAYRRAGAEGKTAGLACGLKNTGVGNGMADECRVNLEIKAHGKLCVHHGWTEMGQGVFTICQQIVCQETGLRPQNIQVMVNTDFKAPAGMTTASRATSLVGNALIAACGSLKKDLLTSTLQDLEGRFYEGHWICDWTQKPGPGIQEPVTHYSYSYAAQCVILDRSGKLERVVAAHDAGKILNPTLFEGQIEGSVHMGLGYAISEEYIQKNGFPVTDKLGKCGVLRASEMPPVDVIGVEVPDPFGPYGAKGVGEIGLVPTAGAVGNALFHFDGKRRYRLPFKERFLVK